MTAIETSLANAFQTTLSAPVTASDLTFNVEGTGTLTSPCYLVIDPDNAAKREYIYFDGTFTSTTFVTSIVGNRGLAGSASGAQTHSAGAKVRCVPMAQHFADLHDRVDLAATDADVVKLAGAQTITGAKTFSTDPTLADGSSALSLTEGNAAYVSKTAGTIASPQNVTGVTRFGPSDGTQLQVRSGSSSVSNFEWEHAASAGYIFHLVSAAGMADPAALIGLGVDDGGVGIYVHNRDTRGGGIGIKITQRAGITNVNHHGMRVNQESASAPASWFGQGAAGAAPVAVFTANVVPNSGQKLVRWLTTVSTASDTELGYVAADTGNLVWSRGLWASAGADTVQPFTVQSANTNTQPLATFTRLGGGGSLTITNSGGVTSTTGALQGTVLHAEAGGAAISLYNTTGTTNQRRWKWTAISGYLVLTARTDADGGAGDALYISHSNKNTGLFGTLQFGGGAGVLGVKDAATVPSTNPTGGGVLYSEGGALKWRGSAGTVTTIAAA